MMSSRWVRLALVVLILSSWASSTPAQDYYEGVAAHSQGNIQLTIQRGIWGNVIGSPDWIPYFDPITRDSIFGCTYPRGSHNLFMYGEIFVGAVVGSDTLVSEIGEFRSIAGTYDQNWSISSSDISSPHFSPSAKSELDLEGRFNDMVGFQDPGRSWPPIWDYGWHEPLGLAVTQRSMAWSGAMVDDFVLIHYEMTNRGAKPLEDLFVGYSCGNPGWTIGAPVDSNDDHLTGFLRDVSFPDQCEYQTMLNLAYYMDNDGDPVAGQFIAGSRRGAVGVMLLGSSSESVRVGYQWYFFGPEAETEWGPRRRPSGEELWRSFNPYFAWPGNDRNWYYLMSQSQVAYDQLFAAVDHSGEGWLSPGPFADEIASGYPLVMHYSFGPFNIGVNERISFTIAIVGGDNVHTDPWADFDPYHPQQFYDQLDFSELAENARWAQWVYDNPGYDTDSDGYAGEFRICNGDTVWYKGDGVPDFRGNSPPPAPFTRFITEPGLIKIRWNGFLTETFKDPFSGLVDFEGYRVYAGLDTRRSSLSVLASYDKENFFRLKYHDLGSGNGKWLNDEPPYTLAELRTIHNDPAFDPHRYTRSYPLFEADSTFYFQMVDANLNDLSSIHGIHKVYPNVTNPGPDSTLWTEDDVTYDYAGRMLPKFYEYEFIHDNLLPTVPYFVSVTSFDFGYAGGRGNLPPDESNPLNNLTEVYAQTSADSVEAYDLDVYVYPNPYRADADYHRRGYENRTGSIIPDRARLLHFANLPNVCKISIFSLDGDLIGEINHDFPEGGPEAMHDWWNLVSRSGLAVESGLYFYTVESATRTQIGKFAIIK